MATFNSFSNVLPDPLNPINEAGALDTANGVRGPGFEALSFISTSDSQVSRSLSGRGVARSRGTQYWSFNISYNPLRREQFEVVEAFLLHRQAWVNPFYVVLPQYQKPRDPAFAEFVKTNIITTATAVDAGKSSFMVATPTYDLPAFAKVGDMFTITDPDDYNHQKVYKVVRVETNRISQAGEPVPGAKQMRLHVFPPLQRDVSAGSTINFLNPKFRVIMTSDVSEYDLDSEALYSYSLNVAEFIP